jgi:hypothetical protein
MSKPFDGKTKQQAINVALNKILSNQADPNRDKLALRQYGGDCHSEENTKLLLRFRRNNQSKIRNILRDLKLAGEAPLASAVVKATNDFPRASDVDKRIIVIAGDGGCDPDATEYIRNRLKASSGDKKINLNFHFIYLGESEEQFKKLEGIAKETGGMAVPANNQERLDAVLLHTIEVEPVLGNIRSSTEILNAVVDRTNSALEALSRKDYSAAEQNLKSAQEQYERTELLFQDFRKRQSRDLFKNAQQVASANRGLQKDVLALMREIIRLAQRGDNESNESYNRSIDKFKTDRDTYNNNVQKLNELEREIAHE